jgi:hypothetical protein
MARLTRSEKITGIDNEIAQLLAQKKTLLQEQKAEERKARTNRLCKRAGHLESLLPDTIKLSDGLFNEFLAKTLSTDYGKRILADLLAEQELADEIAADELVKAQVADTVAKTPDAITAQTSGAITKPSQTAAAQSADTTVKPPQTAANTAQTQRLPNNANANKQTA